MALRNVRRATFSLPKTTLLKLEMNVPKNKRSKFIAELIEKNLKEKGEVTLEGIHAFWDDLATHYKPKSKKSAVESQREDRLSH